MAFGVRESGPRAPLRRPGQNGNPFAMQFTVWVLGGLNMWRVMCDVAHDVARDVACDLI